LIEDIQLNLTQLIKIKIQILSGITNVVVVVVVEIKTNQKHMNKINKNNETEILKKIENLI